jgi:hypothetical protein
MRSAVVRQTEATPICEHADSQKTFTWQNSFMPNKYSIGERRNPHFFAFRPAIIE